MSLFDKLANAGRGSRMPAGQLEHARYQSDTTIHRNKLAHAANGFETDRRQQRAAERALIADVGEKEARRLMGQAKDKALGKA